MVLSKINHICGIYVCDLSMGFVKKKYENKGNKRVKKVTLRSRKNGGGVVPLKMAK